MKKFINGIFVFVLCLILTGCGCTKQKITVTFDTNSDTKISSQTIEKGDLIDKPTVPEKEGYIFDGWYYNGQKFDFSTEISEDIKLEARWIKSEEKTYTIDFKTNGGSEVKSIKVAENGTAKLPTPTKKGYKFIGWYYKDKKINSSTKITEDMTLTAKWEKEITTTKKVVKKTTTTTTKPAETTKSTTTKPVETTKATTTKPVETTTTTTTTSKVVLDYEIEELEYGQIMLYITSNGTRVDGIADITTLSSTVKDFKIPASGFKAHKNEIVSIKNIRLN